MLDCVIWKGIPKSVELKLLVRAEFTLPANSWNTLADANGCKMILPVVSVVPTRRLNRPISLSIGSVVTVETSPKLGRIAVPLRLNESTFVLDQMNPADGSMNQLLGKA